MASSGALPTPALPLYDDLSDAQLAAECLAGRQAAWSTLVRRYQRLVYTVPRRAGLSEAEAADVFQTCFERLHRHLGGMDDTSRLRAWLVTTAKRESLRLLEQAQRLPAALPAGDEGADDDPLAQIADTSPLQDELLSDLQQQHRVRQAVERLDARSQQLVELLFLQDEPLPYAEVARRLGLAEGSIGALRGRCLARLRDLMGPS